LGSRSGRNTPSAAYTEHSINRIKERGFWPFPVLTDLNPAQLSVVINKFALLIKTKKVTEKFTYRSPIGLLTAEAYNGQITRILFNDVMEDTEGFHADLKVNISLQLDEYFAGQRFEFDLPLEPDGTAFQRKVWEQLHTIPYGQQITYLDLAKGMGNRNLMRAVGGANSKNPVAIVIPCHRVIGANNRLIGYAGGIWRKKWLLQHEHTHNLFKTTLL